MSSDNLEIRGDFSPCDLCPAPNPQDCPAEHHVFYCEYIEAESYKPESLRYYTRYLKGQPNPAYTIVKADYTGQSSSERLSDQPRQVIDMATYNIALANARACEHAIVIPRTLTSCCKRKCRINKYPESEYVSRKQCRDCQFEMMGIAHLS
jgi:hypothetical protein